jgi:hypothetical protein
MASRFSSAKNAIAECDRCGFRYKLGELKQLVIKAKNVNIKVCPECWEPDQPQLSLGLYPVNDPQAVRDPRPDTSYYAVNGSRVIEWGWGPVGGPRNFDAALAPNSLVATGAVGSVIAGQTIVGNSFSITAGYATYDDGSNVGIAIGYGNNEDTYGTFGTATPNSILGYPIYACYDQGGAYPTAVLFGLSGFTSQPGQAFFSTITCNGVTLTSASAGYNWDGVSIATWNWSPAQFGLVSGNTYTVTLG